MENKEKAKIIVFMIRQQVEHTTNQYINAKADLAKNEMGHELWQKANDEDLGFARNPYNIELSKKHVKQIMTEKLTREEILKYAIEVFLDKIED